MNFGLSLILHFEDFRQRRSSVVPFDTPIHSPLGSPAMNRETLIRDLRSIVGERYVLIEKEDVVVYEQDGSIFQVMPEIVVLPSNVGEVAAVVKAAKQAAVPIVPRGSGTGLAGGAVPAEGGIILSLARLNRILKIDLENRIAIVEPGVINARRDEGRRQRRPFLRAGPEQSGGMFDRRQRGEQFRRAAHARLRRHHQSRTRPRSRTRRRRQSYGSAAKCRTPRVTIFVVYSSARKEPWESSPKSR